MAIQKIGVGATDRVAAVLATRLLETGPEEAFNRLTRLVSALLTTPMVAFTVVDDVRSFLKGTPDPALLVGPEGTFESPVKEAACQLVVDGGVEVCAPDVRKDPRLRDLAQIRDFNAVSWVGVPVLDPDGRVVGNLCAMDGRVRHWTDAERMSLKTVADAISGEIALRLALRSSAQLVSILQESLVPDEAPQPPGVQVGTRFRPGGTGVDVMGDFYDVVPIRGGFGVVIGDVCGQGATAARATAMARAAVRTSAHSNPEPVRVLSILNEVLHLWFGVRRSFVTAVYATLRPPVGGGTDAAWSVSVASGGHPPGFVLRADRTVEGLEGGGRVLGLAPEPVVAREHVQLRPGDSLVLYTDGVTEAHVPGRTDQFDEPGLAAVLAGQPTGASADALAGAVSEAAFAHGGRIATDDSSVVVVRIDPRPGS